MSSSNRLLANVWDQLDLLRRIVGALATLTVRAVVTTGLAIEPGAAEDTVAAAVTRVLDEPAFRAAAAAFRRRLRDEHAEPPLAVQELEALGLARPVALEP